MSVARGLTDALGSPRWTGGASPRGVSRRERRNVGSARARCGATTTTALFGGVLAKAKKPAAPPKPPAGTETDAVAFKAAGAVLAVPSLGTFVDTESALGAFNVSHSDPRAFETISDVQHFSNVVGTDCFALIALCALYVLSDAAENQRLDSATYQRLALALVLYSSANALGVAAAFVAGALGDGALPSPSPAAVAGVVAALAPAGAVSARAIVAYGGGFGEAFERVKKDWAVVTDLGSATDRGGYLERYLKLSFWASMIVGGSFAFSPLSPLAIVNEYTPSSQFIQRAFGLGTVFMLAPAQFVLLDAAQRGRLGGGTFKKLNLSIALAIAGIDFMTVYTFAAAQALNPDADALKEASGGIYNYVGALAVSFSILAVYLYQGLFAKKDA
jgi:hypothetical protein